MPAVSPIFLFSLTSIVRGLRAALPFSPQPRAILHTSRLFCPSKWVPNLGCQVFLHLFLQLMLFHLWFSLQQLNWDLPGTYLTICTVCCFLFKKPTEFEAMFWEAGCAAGQLMPPTLHSLWQFVSRSACDCLLPQSYTYQLLLVSVAELSAPDQLSGGWISLLLCLITEPLADRLPAVCASDCRGMLPAEFTPAKTTLQVFELCSLPGLPGNGETWVTMRVGSTEKNGAAQATAVGLLPPLDRSVCAPSFLSMVILLGSKPICCLSSFIRHTSYEQLWSQKQPYTEWRHMGIRLRAHQMDWNYVPTQREVPVIPSTEKSKLQGRNHYFIHYMFLITVAYKNHRIINAGKDY